MHLNGEKCNIVVVLPVTLTIDQIPSLWIVQTIIFIIARHQRLYRQFVANEHLAKFSCYTSETTRAFFNLRYSCRVAS